MSALPEPSPEQKTHSLKLQRLIVDGIRENAGRIGFDRYMTQALYQPGLGYYAAGSQKFGATGDFITSPEISPLFAQAIARQLKQVMAELNDPLLIEFGAGSGVLAADLLLELEALQSLPEEYWIVELSADLQQRQQATIEKRCPHLLKQVRWVQQLPETAVNAVVIANEVLDAMPVIGFEKHNGELFERKIAETEGQLHWELTVASEELTATVAEIEASTEQTLPANYRSEYNPSLLPWLKTLSALVNKGLVLLVDYGYDAKQYYSHERDMGTMMCYYRHRAHDDVFFYPGLQDITAFVDFTAVAEAAFKTGWDVMGYTAQAQFLFGCGLAEIFESKRSALAEDDVRQQLHLSQQVKTLTLPSEMGERFKVMALGKDLEPGLIGFSQADFRSRL
ncbi:MAG: SAM-dependent methyltransferase [Gammaproteobacteria bacterium]|nr:SAM-dependent methyltransferase [Gammaproteobacteria bacterium]